jgi:hypothetical protein
MAQRKPTITFEGIPLEEARTMSRGRRMDPQLYNPLREKIQSLGNAATRITLPGGANPTTMKNRILRVAADINIPVTVRRVPGGLLFWHSTNEVLTQARETAQRLQGAQRRRQQSRPGRRRA